MKKRFTDQRQGVILKISLRGCVTPEHQSILQADHFSSVCGEFPYRIRSGSLLFHIYC